MNKKTTILSKGAIESIVKKMESVGMLITDITIKEPVGVIYSQEAAKQIFGEANFKQVPIEFAKKELSDLRALNRALRDAHKSLSCDGKHCMTAENFEKFEDLVEKARVEGTKILNDLGPKYNDVVQKALDATESGLVNASLTSEERQELMTHIKKAIPSWEAFKNRAKISVEITPLPTSAVGPHKAVVERGIEQTAERLYVDSVKTLVNKGLEICTTVLKNHKAEKPITTRTRNVLKAKAEEMRALNVLGAPSVERLASILDQMHSLPTEREMFFGAFEYAQGAEKVFQMMGEGLDITSEYSALKQELKAALST